MIDKDKREKIGWQEFLASIETSSPYGQVHKKNLKPLAKGEVKDHYVALDIVASLPMADQGQLSRLLHHAKEIKGILSKLQGDFPLSVVELYEVKYFLRISQGVKALLPKELLVYFPLVSLQDALNKLEPEHRQEEAFHIYQHYHPELKEIRREKEQLEKEYLSSEREDRGLLLEKRRGVVAKERQIEDLVCEALSDALRPLQGQLQVHRDLLGKLDFFLAIQRRFARETYVKPSFGKELVLKEAYHPVIKGYVESSGYAYQAISFMAEEGVTVITGPNMGGKSSALKTLAFNMLLGRFGFYIFAQEACLPWLTYFHYLAETSEDLRHGLSTFGREITALNDCLGDAKGQGVGLLVLDEFARSTNPLEGAKFIKGISSYLSKVPGFVFIATHFDGVISPQMKHYQVKGLREVRKALGLDDLHRYMNYQLEEVAYDEEVPREAFRVAKLLGLAGPFMDYMEELLKE